MIPDSRKSTRDGRTGWPTIYALTRALQIELGIQSTADNFGPSTQRLFKQWYPNGVRQQAVADKSTSNVYSIIQGALWCKGYSTGGNISQHFYDGTGSAIRKLKADMGIEGDSSVDVEIMGAVALDEAVRAAGLLWRYRLPSVGHSSSSTKHIVHTRASFRLMDCTAGR